MSRILPYALLLTVLTFGCGEKVTQSPSSDLDVEENTTLGEDTTNADTTSPAALDDGVNEPLVDTTTLDTEGDAIPEEGEVEQPPEEGDTLDEGDVPTDIGPDASAIDDADVAPPPPPCQSDEDCLEALSTNPCKRPACNPASGLCIEVDLPVGTPCEGGDMCKVGQVCQSGQCIGGTNVTCADEDPCTTDMCDPAQGCIFQPVEDCCIADCEDKECGSDGCGGSCGICPAEWSCNAESVCINCVPSCVGLTCGPDGCGGVCGTCPDEWFCVDPGICKECLSDCEGKVCGDDGCGGSCGSCGLGQVCDGAFCVACLPDCTGKECGDDGCGGSCGNCAQSAVCGDDGLCSCVPDCAGKQCGDNGCGGICGECDVGDVCTFFDQCQVVTTGKTCESPIVIPGVPFYTAQNTTGGLNASEMPGGLCGFITDVGGGSPEHVYTFTPSESGTYTFHVQPLTFNAAVYLVGECQSPSTTCMMGSDEDADEILVAPLVAEKSYHLVVDGHNDLNSSEGQYSLSVYAGLPVSCTASCEGKVCGTDGCGGSCGECPEGELCTSDGECKLFKVGDTCESPVVIDTATFATEGSFSAAGDTLDLEADYNISGGACVDVPPPGGTGQGASDVVYAFTPPADGNYKVTVPTVWDAVVYIVTDCAQTTQSCVAFSDTAAPNAAETFVAYLLSSETYYIIVDGNSYNTNLGGNFTFKIADYVPENCTPECAGAPCGDDGCGGFCGVCDEGLYCEESQCVVSPMGDTCETAFSVSLPYSASHNTTGSQADYNFSAGACPGKEGGWGLESSDEVFKVSAPQTGIYEITVAPNFDASVYIVTDCDAIDTHCVVASDNFGTATESIVIEFQGGEDYYVIVDGWSNSANIAGGYEISIEQSCSADCGGKSCGNDGCGGICGVCMLDEACVGGDCVALSEAGESCANPFVISHGLGTYYANGDTTNASGDLTHGPADCSPMGTSTEGPDHVYALTALANATYTLTLTLPDDNVDLALWVTTTCPPGPSTCLGDSDITNFAGTAEIVEFTAQQGQTYYIVVDSQYTSETTTDENDGIEAGPYQLEILAQ